MLHGQDRGGHQDGYLLSVIDCLESGTDGYLGFAKTYIPAHETIHGIGFFHVCFYVCR